LTGFNIRQLEPEARRRAAKFIKSNEDSFDIDVVERVSRKAMALAEWVEGIYSLIEFALRLESYPDGPRILNEIETAYEELTKNKAELKRLQAISRCWRNVLDQMEWDIELLKKCEKSLKRIGFRRSVMVNRFESLEVIPQIPDTNLSPAYLTPYKDSCDNINTRFGELTQIEFKFVFLMIKKYFVVLLHLFKTYASFEGKNGQGLKGMSPMIWGILCNAMELPNTSQNGFYDEETDGELKEDDTNFLRGGSLYNEIFNLSAVSTLETDSNQVMAAEKKSQRKEKEKTRLEEREKENPSAMDITGIWKFGESTQRNDLWTLETHVSGRFSGFIGCEKEATIEGTIDAEASQVEFTVNYTKQASRFAGQQATCKGVVLDKGTSLRVWYVRSDKKKGYWLLSKTAAKIRTQSKGISTLKYDNFIEAILRLSISLWPAFPAWDAIEALMNNHAIPIGLKIWDCFPFVDRKVVEILSERDNKRLLDTLFTRYASTKRERKSRFITYNKWEQLVRKLNRLATGDFSAASFRTIQYAFFTSKEFFPQDGSLEELNRREFKEAVVRLAFRMVGGSSSSINNRPVKYNEVKHMMPLDLQCRVMLTWLREVKRK